MRLSKKLAAVLLVAGAMAGSGLAVASPADAVTSMPATSMSTAAGTSTAIPQATVPRWEALGVYDNLVQCENDGSDLQATESNIGGYQCRGTGPWRLWVLITAP